MAIEWKFKNAKPPMKLPRTLLAVILGMMILVQFSSHYIKVNLPNWYSWLEALVALGLLGMIFIDLRISPEEIGILTGVLAAVAFFAALNAVSVNSPIAQALIVFFAIVVVITELKTLKDVL